MPEYGALLIKNWVKLALFCGFSGISRVACPLSASNKRSIMNNFNRSKRPAGRFYTAVLRAKIRFEKKGGKFLSGFNFLFKKAKQIITRRRLESNPNIVCGFPMQQIARPDARLY